MKIYKREITKREEINRFGKLGFVRYVEYVRTDNIEPFNYRKRNRFYVTNDPAAQMMTVVPDQVYSRKVTY